MNYYSHHIGDYLSSTAHLTLLEHGVYRRLIDVYYIHESALPADSKQVYRLIGARTKDEREAVDSVLAEFFTETDDGWHQNRCDHEIALCNKNRTNGKNGGRPPKKQNPTDNPEETQTITQEEPKPNPEQKPPITPSPHHPITNSIEPTSTSELPVAGKEDSPPPSRFLEITKLLCSLEKQRGKTFKAVSTNGFIQSWVESGVTDANIIEAHGIAAAERERTGDKTSINPGYLDGIIARIINPGERQSTVVPMIQRPPEICACCGGKATKRIGTTWFCASHDQYSKRAKVAE